MDTSDHSYQHRIQILELEEKVRNDPFSIYRWRLKRPKIRNDVPMITQLGYLVAEA